MTVSELESRMSSSELTEWIALQRVRNAEQRRAEQRAKRRR